MQLNIALPLITALGRGQTITALLKNSAAITLSVGQVDLVDAASQPTDVFKMRNPAIPYLDASGVWGTRNDRGQFVPYPFRVFGKPSDQVTGKTVVVTNDKCNPVKTWDTWVYGAGTHTQLLASCNRHGSFTIQPSSGGKPKTYRHYVIVIDEALVQQGTITFTCYNDKNARGFPRVTRGELCISEHVTEGMNKFLVDFVPVP